MSKIQSALTKLYQQHRIIFWYDDKQEMLDEYDALEIAGVKKLELNNNEFGLKVRMCVEEPHQKFLVMPSNPSPSINLTGY